jgi:hypothetical protein
VSEKGQIEEPVKRESDGTKFVELFCWSKKVPTLKWRGVTDLQPKSLQFEKICSEPTFGSHGVKVCCAFWHNFLKQKRIFTLWPMFSPFLLNKGHF